MGLKDTIFAAEDLDHEVVDVPEWGVKLEVRSMTAGQRARAMAGWTQDNGNIDIERFYPAILAASCFDPETGERVFDSNDVEKLNEKSAKVIDRLTNIAVRVSGMSPEAVDEAGEGSSSARSGDSSST